MGRRAKTLIDHVRDGSFIPSRHGQLLELEGAQLPRQLKRFAERYSASRSERERQAIAVDFRDAIRTHADTSISLDLALYAAIGPFDEPVTILADGTYQYPPPWRRWLAWDRDHGLRWRAENDCLTAADYQELARRFRVKTHDRFERDRLMDELAERFLARQKGPPAPDPPRGPR